jgi:hypothetical protein
VWKTVIEEDAWTTCLNCVSDPDVRHFLAERVNQDTTSKAQLHAFVERSKTEPKMATAATNAITF